MFEPAGELEVDDGGGFSDDDNESGVEVLSIWEICNVF